MTEEMDEEERQFWAAQHYCNAHLPQYKWNMEQVKKIHKATRDVKAGRWPEEVNSLTPSDMRDDHADWLVYDKEEADAAISTLKGMVKETQTQFERVCKVLHKNSAYLERRAEKAEAEVPALKAELERAHG